MDTAQTSSSQPVATQRMRDDPPVWATPKKNTVIDAWDFDGCISEDNRCQTCRWSGVYIDEQYDPDRDSVRWNEAEGRYFTDRTLLYVAEAHSCQWQIRGRETVANFPLYLLRKAEDGFDWSPWKAKQPAYADYLANIEDRLCTGDGLVLIGSVGTGKTHLAVHAGRVAVRRGYSVFFSTVTELLSDLRQTFRDGSILTEKQIMAHLVNVDLLILDDATVEKQTDWTQDALYRIVNARYEVEKTTMLTANVTLDQMRERLGERLVSRLYERSIVLDFTGADYRLQVRKQRQSR